MIVLYSCIFTRVFSKPQDKDEPLKLQMTKEQVASLKEQIDVYNAVEQPVYKNTFYPSCLHMN